MNWLIGHPITVSLTVGLLQLCGNRIAHPSQVRPFPSTASGSPRLNRHRIPGSIRETRT
jgi:hypothetical protein